MPDVGVPIPHSTSPQISHTSTHQWQSFEIRMRYRRAERCIARAEAALAAGDEDGARAALAEARALNPETPSVEQLAAVIDERNAAAATARRAKGRRRLARAAVIALAVAGGAVGLWLRSSDDGESRTPAPGRAEASTSPSASTPKPMVASVDQPPAQMDPAVASPFGESPVRAGGLDRPSDPPVTRPDPAPAAPPEPALPTVQEIGPAPRVEVPAPAGTAAIGSALPQVTGTDGLVGSLPSAALPVVTIPPPAPPPPAAEAKPVETPAVSEEPRVRAVLAQFESAYSTLSASAAQAVWPSVDAHMLGRAFDNLVSQRVSLGHCSIVIKGPSARAECSGTTSWTPKVGGGRRSEMRRWEIDLAAENGTWYVLQATAR